MKPLGLYVGTFDPATKGHTSVAKTVAERYNTRIGVAMNAGKSPVFTLPERLSLTQKVMGSCNIDPLAVTPISGSVARHAKRQGIDHVIRGKRNIVDEVGEEGLSHFYELEHPSLQVETLPSDEALKFASSSAAKELTHVGHDVRSIVSLAVKEALESRLIRQYPLVISGSMGSGKSSYAREIVSYARSKGLSVTHIDFDAIAHDIYSSLSEPIYANVRDSIRKEFNLHGASGDWIDRSSLRKALLVDSKNPKSSLDNQKLLKLNHLLSDAMLFRYRDKITGIKGIILIDGATVIDNGLTHLANNHALLINAPEEVRVERVMKRYAKKGDNIDESFVRSMMTKQTNVSEKTALLEKEIDGENNGSISHLENHGSIDARKALFQALNQIDRFGDLRTSFIFTLLGVQGDYDTMTQELRNLYDAPGRYYHTWEHITACLKELFEVAIHLNLDDDEISILGGAILFHDIVYEVSDNHYYQANEQRSAQFGSHYLENHGVNPIKSMQINELIRETAHGRYPLKNNLLSYLMHDIDMSILGANPRAYRIYGQNIRNELTPLVSGAVFEKIRQDKFLTPTLKQGSIYMSGYYQEKYEKIAMENLHSELHGNILFTPKDI